MHQEIKKNIRIRNNVKVSGYGTQAMVFAAGFGCDQNMWRYIAPSFADDYRVILFDYVGAGESDLQAYSTERYGDLQGYAQDVLDVLAALDVNKAVFVGHSVGCIIGLLASIQEPERFERIVMIGPSPCYLNDENYTGGFERESLEGLMEMMDKNDIGWVNLLAPTIMKNEDRPELTEELKESFCSTDPTIARNFARVTFFSDNRSDLPKATVPSLVLQSCEDAIAPTSVGEYIHYHMPQSTYKVLKATGHCPHMSHPGEIIERMRSYLVSKSPSRARRQNNQIHQLPCGFLSFSLDGKIIVLNERLLDWLGYHVEELEGKPIDSILTASSILFHQMYFFPMIRLHGKVENIFLTLLSKDGSELPMRINGTCHNLDGTLIVECLILKSV